MKFLSSINSSEISYDQEEAFKIKMDFQETLNRDIVFIRALKRESWMKNEYAARVLASVIDREIESYEK